MIGSLRNNKLSKVFQALKDTRKRTCKDKYRLICLKSSNVNVSMPTQLKRMT